MVKFAEAEKRGRGGDSGNTAGGSGSGSTNRPFMMMDRQKINRAMLEGLKEHIIRERRRKQEELQEEEAEERRRKEQESRKKQHAMTLEETNESIAKETLHLEQLQAKKHDLFQQLKKVLNPEKNKRKERPEHNTYIKETDLLVAHQQYQQQQQQLAAMPVHPQQVVFPNALLHSNARSPAQITTMYKLAPQTAQQPPPQQVNIKRPRSPSPPAPYTAPTLPYAFKGVSSNTTTVVPVTQQQAAPKAGGSSGYHAGQTGGFYHGGASTTTAHPPPPTHLPPPSHHHGSAPPPLPAASVSHHPPPHHSVQPSPHLIPSHHPSSQTPLHHSQHHPPPGQYGLLRDDKHAMSVYMTRGVHGLDHKKGGEGDKLYSGGHPLPLHTLPLQQQGAVKGGSITSGFPVRAPLAPPTTQPPHPSASSATHSYSGNHAPAYTLSRNFYNPQ